MYWFVACARISCRMNRLERSGMNEIMFLVEWRRILRCNRSNKFVLHFPSPSGTLKSLKVLSCILLKQRKIQNLEIKAWKFYIVENFRLWKFLNVLLFYFATIWCYLKRASKNKTPLENIVGKRDNFLKRVLVKGESGPRMQRSIFESLQFRQNILRTSSFKNKMI